MSSGGASVHASAVLVDDRAVLIRGPSGSGKSHLAFDLILAGRAGQIPSAVLIGDDRVHLQVSGKELVVRPAPELAGLIEIRGLGIRRCEFASQAKVGLVVDLWAGDAERLPPVAAMQTTIYGIKIPRVPVGREFNGLSMVLAALTIAGSSSPATSEADCSKGFGNHIGPSIATE
jgi:HPr kinase/phosphorylase